MQMKQCVLFGNRLKKLRNEKNMTQLELSDKLEIQRVTIAKYEKGERAPTLDHLIAFAQFFNVSTDYLLGLTENATTDIEVKAVCDYTGLSSRNVDLLNLLNKTHIAEKNSTNSQYNATYLELINTILLAMDSIPLGLTSLKKAVAIKSVIESNEELKQCEKGYYIDSEEYRKFLMQDCYTEFHRILNLCLHILSEDNEHIEESLYPTYHGLVYYNRNSHHVTTLRELCKESIIKSEKKEVSEDGKHNPQNE